MFKISVFSRLSKVSLKTLRYYDQIGILKPRKVDHDTGYRYYSADQLLELNRILIYKELGFTLPQISQLLQEEITLENIQGMFRLKRSEIQQIIDTEQAKLVRIEERMKLIEEEGQVETGQEIRIKAEGAQPFLFQKACGREEDIPTLFRKFDQFVTKEIRQWLQGPQVVLWRDIDGKEDEFEFEVGYFLTCELQSFPEPFQLRTLPPEPMMATMAFHSNSKFDGAACVHLAKWIEKNNYQIKEDESGRELYLPLSPEQEAQFIEIQIPIRNR
ncbi:MULTISPECIES: MerR family transcriptional regulator [Paenibacillus]|uniref:DNA-binding transcriptional MerR regulator n=1 Tax=Paenibacillus pabuli TaxID=1472 RepID=A0A855Y0T6_9BACL|nr:MULTISPECIES: MerR family transcriptional regulator [Paenibacillus]PWW34330.1 DNA-binding transcriptional MerR regulator [Paenibacillus pabuli]PXW00751.1 DNA-binding transcriptional MerR regulator [Paenibacillus taichungensis]RAI98305.1 DNA-binding transcriptional MerR regulator [Paenibacillus pabuli]